MAIAGEPKVCCCSLPYHECCGRQAVASGLPEGHICEHCGTWVLFAMWHVCQPTAEQMLTFADKIEIAKEARKAGETMRKKRYGRRA